MPDEKSRDLDIQRCLSEYILVCDQTEKQIKQVLLDLFKERNRKLALDMKQCVTLYEEYEKEVDKINKQYEIDESKHIQQTDNQKREILQLIDEEYRKRDEDFEKIKQNSQEELETQLRVKTAQYEQIVNDVDAEINKLIDLAEGDHATIVQQAVYFETHYIEECKKRRNVSLELLDLKGDFYVICYIRPPLREEQNRAPPYLFPNNNTLRLVRGNKDYEFEVVVPPDRPKEEMYDQIYPFIEQFVVGINSNVIIYSQPNSGKKDFLEDSGNSKGLYWHILTVLFDRAKEYENCYRYRFSISIADIIDDNIIDLLSQDLNHYTKNDIKPDGSIPNLTSLDFASFSEGERYLKNALERRTPNSNVVTLISMVRYHLRINERVKSVLSIADLVSADKFEKSNDADSLKQIYQKLDYDEAFANNRASLFKSSSLMQFISPTFHPPFKSLVFGILDPLQADINSLDYLHNLRLNINSRIQQKRPMSRRKSSVTNA